MSEGGDLHLRRFLSLGLVWAQKGNDSGKGHMAWRRLGVFAFGMSVKADSIGCFFVYVFVCMYAAREVRRCLLNETPLSSVHHHPPIPYASSPMRSNPLNYPAPPPPPSPDPAPPTAPS